MPSIRSLPFCCSAQNVTEAEAVRPSPADVRAQAEGLQAAEDLRNSVERMTNLLIERDPSRLDILMRQMFFQSRWLRDDQKELAGNLHSELKDAVSLAEDDRLKLNTPEGFGLWAQKLRELSAIAEPFLASFEAESLDRVSSLRVLAEDITLAAPIAAAYSNRLISALGSRLDPLLTEIAEGSGLSGDVARIISHEYLAEGGRNSHFNRGPQDKGYAPTLSSDVFNGLA